MHGSGVGRGRETGACRRICGGIGVGLSISAAVGVAVRAAGGIGAGGGGGGGGEPRVGVLREIIRRSGKDIW